MPAPAEQTAAEADVLATLQNLAGKGYDSADLTVMLTAPGGVPNPAKGPQQTHRQHAIAVSGKLVNGTVTVKGSARNRVNQPILAAPSPSPVPAAPAVSPS